MEATQAMTGSGGWPMTVVATPDGRPFFAGTYFPKERRGGQIGFVELCERIGELWATRRAGLLEKAGRSEGRRGGEEGVSTGGTRWWACHYTKTNNKKTRIASK